MAETAHTRLYEWRNVVNKHHSHAVKKDCERHLELPPYNVNLKENNRNIVLKSTIFPNIGKKIHQSLVSVADKEIQNLDSIENAENSVRLVSSIIRLHWS